MRIPRNTLLNKSTVQAHRGELVDTNRTGEEAALIFPTLDLHDECAGKRRLNELQGRTSNAGIGTTNRPPQLRIAANSAMISDLMFQGRIRR